MAASALRVAARGRPAFFAAGRARHRLHHRLHFPGGFEVHGTLRSWGARDATGPRRPAPVAWQRLHSLSIVVVSLSFSRQSLCFLVCCM